MTATPSIQATCQSFRMRVTVRSMVVSLFQFGMKRLSLSQKQANEAETSFPSHMPTLAESGLGSVKFNSVISSNIGQLADQTFSKRRNRGTYTQYTPEQQASIGKCAIENGNEKARCHF